MTRVLLVANRTAGDTPLVDAVRRRARRGPVEFHLVVPATPRGLHRVVDPEVAGREEARARLAAALPLLSQVAGRPVTGHVGDADPLAAVQDALNLLGFDEIILSTLPLRLSRWLHVDLPRKVRALGLPITHVAEEVDPGLGINAWLPAAGWILDAGLRCVLEVHDRDWEPRLLMCYDDLDGVEASVERWVATTPGRRARIAGYTRDLRRVEAAPTALVA